VKLDPGAHVFYAFGFALKSGCDSVAQQPANTGQVNANVGQQAPAAPVAPQQRRHDDPPRANRLSARDLLRDFKRDGLEVYNSPQTNLGAALAALNHLEDSPMV
jgi:hypothetical protein